MCVCVCVCVCVCMTVCLSPVEAGKLDGILPFFVRILRLAYALASSPQDQTSEFMATS